MRRAHLASLLKEHCLVEGGDSNVKQWLKDEGLDASVANALKVCLQPEMFSPASCPNSAPLCSLKKDLSDCSHMKCPFCSSPHAKLSVTSSDVRLRCHRP